MPTFSGLSETGAVDDATLDLMKVPRCGIKDDILSDKIVADNIKDIQKVVLYSPTKGVKQKYLLYISV